MKNPLLKAFLGVFAFVNIFCYAYIFDFFYILSDALYSLVAFDVFCVVLACLFVLTFTVFLFHFFKYRDKRVVVETVEFSSPSQMTPVEVGFLVDGVVDGTDMSALFVYWASKKYVEISKDEKKQTMIKLVDKLPETSKNFEITLFNAIFSGKKKKVLIDEIPNLLQVNNVVSNCVKMVEKDVGNKFFNSKVVWLRQFYIIIVALLFYVSAMYFRLEFYYDIVPIVEIFAMIGTVVFVVVSDWLLTYFDHRHKNHNFVGRTVALGVGLGFIAVLAGLCCYFYWTDPYQVVFLVCALAIMTIILLMSRKFDIYTNEGAEKLGQILGFKRFIEVAESDRIKLLAEENPAVFYDVLPYAFVLGVSDVWIKQFDVLKISNPAMFDENFVINFYVYNRLFANLNLSRAILMAKTARYANTINSINFGSSAGGGKKGGSNFGGFRRR